jgi:hypothetical protein
MRFTPGPLVAARPARSAATLRIAAAVVVQCGLAAFCPAAIVHYGNDVPFPDSFEGDDNTPNVLFGSKYTVTQSIELQKAGIIFNGFAITNAKVGIYTDAGGAPHTLVAETGAFEVAFDTYLETPMLTTPTIPAGDYWFMAVYDAHTGVGLSYADSVQSAFVAHAFHAPLPAKFPSPHFYTGPALNYYLIGETTILGDFDLDGDVDGQDFLTWQRNPSVGQLTNWRADYGRARIGSESAAVPEPSALVLVGILYASLYWRVR